MARFLNSLSLYELYGALFMVVITLIIYGLHQKLRKPIKQIMFLPYAIVAISLDVFLRIFYESASILFLGIEVVCGLLFMFAIMRFFEVVIVRGVRGKMTSLELVCGGSFVVAIFCGLSVFRFYDFEIVKLFSFFVVLYFAYCFDAKATLFMSAVMGLGTLLYSNNAFFVAPILIWALVAICFKSRRIYMLVSCFLVEAVIGIYFNLYYSYSIVAALPCVVAGLVFMALPIRFFTWSQDYYNSTFGSLTMQNIVNRDRELMQKRLYKLSGVFSEMNTAFRGMMKGKMAMAELKSLMHSELKSALCIDCPEKHRCHRVYENETSAIIENLIDVAFEKGKITILDIPSVLTSRCFKVNQFVYRTNELISQYKSYASMVTSVDASRVLIAEQLFGVAGVMKKLAGEMGQVLDFDKGLEKKIIG
ncbi:MAG: hypothetical protein IJA69_03325, partial [Clostridia bacterium]|nr:hypothetical protein [Clostridia bacterium]